MATPGSAAAYGARIKIAVPKVFQPMKKQTCTTLLIATFGLAAIAADTSCPASYSLELDADLRPSQHFFPLGMLGGGRFDVLPEIGFNLAETGHCCYAFKAGKPCAIDSSKLASNGMYFPAIWAAHTLYHGGETAHFGPVKRPMNTDGNELKGAQIDYHEQAMRDYVKACAAASVEHVLANPKTKVWAWGIDNEWEPHLNYSPAAMREFRTWLKKEWHGDISALNTLWHNDYASFSDITAPAPDKYRDQPAAWLAWRRFSEEAYTDFIAEYFQAIYQADPASRAVLSKSTQCSLEMTYVSRNRINNHMLLAEKTRPFSRGWFCIDMYGHNDRNAYEANYIWNCIRPTPQQHADGAPEGRVFAAETNNHSGPGFQFAQTFWRYVANGVKGFDFFVMGSFRAFHDYSTFGFIDAYDGQPRDRMFYLSRFANMIHRSEAFWSSALPADNAPRIAMLLPQRDVMLSQDSNRSWWDYGINDRLGLYKRLRDAGYWIDAIPYNKLEMGYLSRYQALALISAEHLSADECAAITNFVHAGGILLCDTQPGYFDERHQVVNGLDELLGVNIKGVYTGIHFSPDDVWYANANGFVLRADGCIRAELAGAELLNREDTLRNDKCAWVTARKHGAGTAYWFATRLGTLRAESTPDAAVTEFISSFLKNVQVAPAYYAPDAPMDNLRVEVPLLDAKGNAVAAVASNSSVALEPFTLSLAMPSSLKAPELWWGAADNTRLEPIPFTRDDNGRYHIAMPRIASAGMLYFLADHPPMLGIAVQGDYATAKNDLHTPLLQPGQGYAVEVHIVDPSKRGYAGDLEMAVHPGWRVEPASQPVQQGIQKYLFTVTAPEPTAENFPSFLYPLAVTLRNDQGRVAVGNHNVMVAWDMTRYPSVLSDNPPNGTTLSHNVIRTNTTYRYILPNSGKLTEGQEIRDPYQHAATGGNPALNFGVIGRWNLRADVLFTKIPAVCIEFDLQNTYRLDTLRLAKGRKNALRRVAIATSTDGKTFSTPQELDPQAIGLDLSDFVMNGTTARYLRIDLGFAETSATFGEVEIWGRTLQ